VSTTERIWKVCEYLLGNFEVTRTAEYFCAKHVFVVINFVTCMLFSSIQLVGRLSLTVVFLPLIVLVLRLPKAWSSLWLNEWITSWCKTLLHYWYFWKPSEVSPFQIDYQSFYQCCRTSNCQCHRFSFITDVTRLTDYVYRSTLVNSP